MDSMNLKDFHPEGGEDFETDTELSSSTYHEEINTLKIDKLSNRVTIISIIIPCLIGAILVFAYLDIKERVVDVDLTKQNQYEKISQQLEEKLNALDMKIAKNSFNFDKKLPELGKKNLSLEGQIAKLSTLKADSKSINKHFSKIEKLISNNANQDKTTLQAIERINRQNLAAIKKNRVKFDKTTEQIKEKTKLLEEETKLLEENFSAKLMELSDFEVQIGELRKDISLLDKKYNKIDQSYNEQTDLEQKTNQKINDLETLLSTATKKLDKQLKTLNQKLSANISRIQKDIDHISQAASKPSQPQPQINIDSSNQEGIKQESLKQ